MSYFNEKSIIELFEPIEGHDPAGINIRKSSEYDEYIKLGILRSTQQSEKEKDTYWYNVIDLCSTILKKRSKDLHIAVWLFEALIALDKFEGLSCGLKIISGLYSNFWDDLYPKMKKNSMTARAKPIESINRNEGINIPYQIRLIPLTQNPKFNLDDLKQTDIQDISIQDTDLNFFESQFRHLTECKKNIVNLHNVLNEKFKIFKITETTISRLKETSEQHSDIPMILVETIENKLKNQSFLSKKDFDRKIKDKVFLKNKIKKVIKDNDDANKYLEIIFNKCTEEASNAPQVNLIEQAINECYEKTKILLEERNAIEDKIIKKRNNNLVTHKQEQQELNSQQVVYQNQTANVSYQNQIGSIINKEDGSNKEENLWELCLKHYNETQNLQKALEPLLDASCHSSSEREKNRYFLLMAKLCIIAAKPEVAKPILKKLYELVEEDKEIKLIDWESPLWISEVIGAYYKCLKLMENEDENEDNELKETLFKRLCNTDIRKALDI